MRVFDLGAQDDPAPVSDRILTLPNALSLARLAALPWVFFDLTHGRLLRAMVVLTIVAGTDWLDGYLARRLNQVSRLGVVLDPISDRALFLVVGVGYVVADLLPLWALLVVLARDLAVIAGGGVLLLGPRTAPPAVTRIGKTATFGLMTAFVMLGYAAALGGGADDPWPWLHTMAWILLGITTILYYISAGQYAWTLWRQRAAQR